MHEANTAKQDNIDTGRRGFFNKLWLFLGVVALAELIGLVVTFLKSRKPSSAGDDEENIVVAGAAADFKPNTVTAFQRGHFYLVRLETGGFMALSRQCTHLGCTVPWIEEEKRFSCPCHASAFDITGDILNSPATRALDYFDIKIENNMVRVNTRRRIKRSQFRPEQVTYP